MTKCLSRKILHYISKQYPEKDTEELEIIEYGLEGIISTIPKLMLVVLLGYFLSILAPLFVAIFSFASLRTFASGVHLKKGWTCLLFTSFAFLAMTYLGVSIPLPLAAKSGIFLISILLLFLYAPADTQERPLVMPEARKRMKVWSLAVAISLLTIVLLLPSNSVIGCVITWSVFFESVMTTPAIYYLLKRRYRNYEFNES